LKQQKYGKIAFLVHVRTSETQNFNMLFSRFLNVCFVLASTTIDLTRAAAQSKAISRFEIHLTNAQVDPIGAGSRPGILINGSFIGPTLHVEQGVEVEFVVRNYMKENTTVHFHGIAQSKTPWSDGVPGRRFAEERSSQLLMVVQGCLKVRSGQVHLSCTDGWPRMPGRFTIIATPMAKAW
jgi:hypothetical protein